MAEVAYKEVEVISMAINPTTLNNQMEATTHKDRALKLKVRQLDTMVLMVSSLLHT